MAGPGSRTTGTRYVLERDEHKMAHKMKMAGKRIQAEGQYATVMVMVLQFEINMAVGPLTP